MSALNEQVTLQPGDYIATADLSEEDYHKVAKSFMAAGAYPLEYNEDESLNDEWKYLGWRDDNDLEFWDDANKFADENRQLTLPQILNATNAGAHANQPTSETNTMHLTDRLEAAILASSEANAEVERLQAEWCVAYPNVSGCVDIDVEDIKPEDWMAGDIVECVVDAHAYAEKGSEYLIAPHAECPPTHVAIFDNDGDITRYPIDSFKFIRRP